MNFTKLVFVAVLMVIGEPGFCDTWAIQYNDKTSCTARYDGDSAPAVSNGVAVPFVPFAGDNEVANYAISGGILQHINQTTGQSDPNPAAAKALLLTDSAISNVARVQLMQFVGLLNDYPVSPAAVKQSWADIVAVYGPSGSSPTTWLTQDVITAVQNDCAAASMPLQ